MIEGLAKKYELSEADIERVLAASLEIPQDRIANGVEIVGCRISSHAGQVFGACRHVRSSVTLGASARFMRAAYKLALFDLIAEAKALGANAIINVTLAMSQGDGSYYISLTGDAVAVEAV